MTLPTPYPALNSTSLTSSFGYISTTTNNLGGPILLFVLWLVAYLQFRDYIPWANKAQFATFITLLVSIFFQPLELSYGYITGALIAILVLLTAYMEYKKPTYG